MRRTGKSGAGHRRERDAWGGAAACWLCRCAGSAAVREAGRTAGRPNSKHRLKRQTNQPRAGRHQSASNPTKTKQSRGVQYRAMLALFAFLVPTTVINLGLGGVYHNKRNYKFVPICLSSARRTHKILMSHRALHRRIMICPSNKE